MPISSLGLTYPVSAARVSTGIPRLDTMFGGKGYYCGTSVLVSGTAGSGKTSLAAAFADSICGKGEKCLYLSFEESPDQIIRNMGSIGFDLGKWAKKGLMKFRSVRPTMFGLETHLVSIHKLVEDFKPTAVVVDPVTNLSSIGDTDEIKAMMMRIIDFLKNKQITAVFTSLTSGGSAFEQSEIGISSLMDTWILLRNIETDGERNRLLYILKSRGMAHSNQVREFILSDNGIALRDVYIGSGTVLTGSARMVQEAKDSSQELLDNQAAEHRQLELRQQHLAIDAQIAALKAQSEGIQKEMKQLSANGRQKNEMLHQQKE